MKTTVTWGGRAPGVPKQAALRRRRRPPPPWLWGTVPACLRPPRFAAVPLLLKQRDAITNWAELPAQYTQGWDAATPLCDWSRVECNEQEPGAVSYTL